MKRGTRVHPDYIPKLKQALRRNGFPRQIDLAEAIGVSKNTVNSFLNGKPVEHLNFLELCNKLGYDWREVADFGENTETQNVPNVNPHSPSNPSAVGAGLDANSTTLTPNAKEIRRLARVYPQVRVIVTCRTQSFSGEMDWKSLRFQFVEVADFYEAQVRAFAQHWFKAVIEDESGGLAKAKEFLEQLFLESNKPIRELAITPILLSLTCAVFHQTGKFYSKCSKLYEEGLELLMN